MNVSITFHRVASGCAKVFTGLRPWSVERDACCAPEYHLKEKYKSLGWMLVYPIISPISLIPFQLALSHCQSEHMFTHTQTLRHPFPPNQKSQPAVTKFRHFINTVYWLILPSKIETINNNQDWRVWDSLWVKDCISCLKRTNSLLLGVIGNKGRWCITREEKDSLRGFCRLLCEWQERQEQIPLFICSACWRRIAVLASEAAAVLQLRLITVYGWGLISCHSYCYLLF